MMRALWSAASGMVAQQLNVDTIANNLANVNTAGFKKTRVDFQDLLYQTERVPGAPSAEGVEVPTGLQVGLGVRPAATTKIFSEGTFENTGNPLDLAIEGEGFFQVLMPDGTHAYTRAGALKMDSQGNVVTSDGYPIDPPIVVPADATAVSVGEDGSVSATIPGQTAPQSLGRLQLARFPNPAGLSAIGHSLYVETAASGQPTTGTAGLNGFGTISQGIVELSNVEVVEEMVNMITAQRAYEANAQAIKVADEMLHMANTAQSG